MKKLRFTKMQGAGNDYIYIDCFLKEVKAPEALAIRLSDRNFGVGGDGLVLISGSDKADAKMRMFNADGSEGSMCGNAIRCVAKYVFDKKYTASKKICIETKSGIKSTEILEINGDTAIVKADMGKACFDVEAIPVIWDGKEVINMPVMINKIPYSITCVSMGNPHCVVFTQDIDNIVLEDTGPYFENYRLFPDRINTEFAEIAKDGTISMRVWERGSGETLACGTGACAVVAAAVKNGFAKADADVLVKLRGGDLHIRYTEEAVFMTGEAVTVFEGEVIL